MKTKILIGLLLFSLSSFFFTGCSDDGTGQELKLSVDDKVYIDGRTCTFDILAGNGGYSAAVSNPAEAAATVEGNQVTVEMFSCSAEITIMDRRKNRSSITVYSWDSNLYSYSYSIFIHPNMIDIEGYLDWDGYAGYTIEKQKGNSANLTFDANDKFTVSALSPGFSYFIIKDREGALGYMTVIVEDVVTMESDKLELTASDNQLIMVMLKYGAGDWKLRNSYNTDLIKDIYIVGKASADKQYDILYIETTNERIKGRTYINLEDKDGNKASITLTFV